MEQKHEIKKRINRKSHMASLLIYFDQLQYYSFTTELGKMQIQGHSS